MKNVQECALGRGKLFQYIALISGTFNILSSGLHNGWTSPSLPKLLSNNSHIPITNDEGSWIAIIYLIGAAFGAIIATLTLDRIGRKNLVLLASFPILASWIMIAFAKSFIVLLIARLIAGIADGMGFCSAQLYLGEISDPKIRGFLVSFSMVVFTFALLLINLIGYYLSIQQTALICAIFPILLLLIFPWMPKSPYYLVMKEKYSQARRSLRIFKGTIDVEHELNRLIRAVDDQRLNEGKFFDLFKVKSNRKAVWLTIGLRTIQQCSGMVGISYYAQTLFTDAQSSISPILGTAIFYGVQVLIAGLCSVLVDRIGRRTLLIASLLGLTLALLTESCYFYIRDVANLDTTSFSLVPVAALISFVILLSLGTKLIPYLIVTEIFPISVRSFAVGLSDVYNLLLATVITKFFQFTKDSFGLHVPFISFAILSTLGLLFCIFFVPETKGKTLEEIQDLFKDKRQDKSRKGLETANLNSEVEV